jgi:hypothetical protein
MLMLKREIIAAGCALGMAAALLASPACAHSRRDAPPVEGGIAIPQLSHGQMAVIAGYRGAILDLAARQPRTDPTLRRLTNFAEIQYTWCLWGLAPGSLSDETSPFNECAHAYLAAAQAVLLHMQAMADAPGPVHALAMQIEGDMLRSNASLLLCRFSGQSFNTAAILSPRWGEIVAHPPTLATLLGLILAAAGSLYLLLRRRTT